MSSTAVTPRQQLVRRLLISFIILGATAFCSLFVYGLKLRDQNDANRRAARVAEGLRQNELMQSSKDCTYNGVPPR
jgi:hypothetical protein